MATKDVEATNKSKKMQAQKVAIDRRSKFTLAKPVSPELYRAWKRIRLRNRLGKIIPTVVALVVILLGNYLIVSNQSFSSYQETGRSSRRSTTLHQYEVFGDGIVRFDREGVTYLDHNGHEAWIQSGQTNDPVFVQGGNSFAIYDRGGNRVMVFQRNGLFGEFDTPLPIDRVSVSSQGIIAALMRSSDNPVIITYDAVGNMLTENQVALGVLGYPTALSLSPDGTLLAVAFLSINGGEIRTNLIYYNFSAEDFAATDFVVTQDVLSDRIVPDIRFLSNTKSLVFTDQGVLLYEGASAPGLAREVTSPTAIQAIASNRDHFLLVSLASAGNGYDVRIFDAHGHLQLERSIDASFHTVQMYQNEIVFFDNSSMLVLSHTGIVRYQGPIEVSPLLVVPAFGINAYHIFGSEEVRSIRLIHGYNKAE